LCNYFKVETVFSKHVLCSNLKFDCVVIKNN
jgi:hypothetical protein